jgi:hypothetical protein
VRDDSNITYSLFGWLVADGWCWFVLREKYCWLVADGWFVLREKYCWLVADKPSEQAVNPVQLLYMLHSQINKSKLMSMHACLPVVCPSPRAPCIILLGMV